MADNVDSGGLFSAWRSHGLPDLQRFASRQRDGDRLRDQYPVHDVNADLDHHFLGRFNLAIEVEQGSNDAGGERG